MPLIGRGRTRRRLEGTTEARNTTPIAALNLRDDGNLSSDNSTQQPDDVPSIEPYSPPDVDSPGNTNGPPTRKRGRGPAKSTEFEKLRKHGKITLKINDGETSPCCENYVVFTTRVTWILKHHGDLSHPSWHDVPENEQQELISRVRADFFLDWTKKNHCDTVMKALRKRFNHIRYDLHKRYKQYGTNEEALANGPHLVSPENWVKLCSRWSSEGFKMISERNKCNREKQQTNHTTGRTSFVRLLEMRSENDGDNLVDFFKEVRWSKKKGTFVTPMMEEMHVSVFPILL
ncbi:uncharacterized protein LOC122280042 [Carya illinoinensis]|uniref:uncharacterized protein LOC122280042 n=1 Tax=Carya illinoinensis TaxID=32201 RepID=UPI001C7251D1|nr:uncharacterized protein LOC122280042 [Carya illinoinensis]XP_042946931.1 uncharacterized protein LOC122280042 [Carya illinoinensis]